MHEAPAKHLEIERKYEVTTDAVVPALNSVGFTLSSPRVFELSARYLDTADFLLASERIAVRHRTGGDDAGWHIKQRTAVGVAETEWPDTPAMPAALRETLAELIGAPVGELSVVGRIDTYRTSRRILTTDGEPVAELVDDLVRARDEVQGVSRSWREWEVELFAGVPESLLDAIEPALGDAGALPSLAESKISRTMGWALDMATARGATAEHLAALAVTDVADRLTEQARTTTNGDSRIASLRRIAHNLLAKQ